jgi:UDP-N-acetylmuramoylalanine--D-glutamate ligase
MTAIALTLGYAIPGDVEAVADRFLGVPHRLELVRELPREGGAIRFYNSSIDSSPTRTLAALSAITEMNAREGRTAPVVICGGQDKQIPFDVLGPEVCKHTKAVFLNGTTAPKIRQAIEAAPNYTPGNPELIDCSDFTDAVQKAAAAAASGDIVLMSPACAAFDQFKNFMERGAYFKKLIMEL